MVWIYLVNFQTNIFWDSGVYIAMGKYFFGGFGLYESFRPPLYPLIIGLFWKMGLNAIIISRVVILIFGLLSIVVFQKLVSNFLSDYESYFWAFVFMTFPTFLFYYTRGLNDVLSLFLTLSCFLFLLKKKYLLTGLFAGLAFLTRFNNGLLVISIALFILLDKSSFKDKILNSLKSGLLFLTLVVPYLFYNYHLYGNPIKFLIDGSAIMKLVGLSIHEPWWYYFSVFISENLILLFAILGIVIFLKTKDISLSSKYSLISYLFLSFLYFSSLARKEMRYALSFLPFLLILVAFGLRKILLKKKLLVIILICVSIFFSITGFSVYQTMFIGEISDDIYDNFYNRDLTGLTVFSSPIYLAYYDIESSVIYDVSNWKLSNSGIDPMTYIINDCDLFCVKGDLACQKIEDDFISNLSESHIRKVFKETTYCKYYVFEKNLTITSN